MREQSQASGPRLVTCGQRFQQPRKCYLAFCSADVKRIEVAVGNVGLLAIRPHQPRIIRGGVQRAEGVIGDLQQASRESWPGKWKDKARGFVAKKLRRDKPNSQ